MNFLNFILSFVFLPWRASYLLELEVQKTKATNVKIIFTQRQRMHKSGICLDETLLNSVVLNVIYWRWCWVRTVEIIQFSWTRHLNKFINHMRLNRCVQIVTKMYVFLTREQYKSFFLLFFIFWILLSLLKTLVKGNRRHCVMLF